MPEFLQQRWNALPSHQRGKAIQAAVILLIVLVSLAGCQ